MPSKHRKWGQSIGWKRSLKRMEECVDVNTIVTDRLSALATSEVKRLGEPISLLGGRMGKREDARVVEVSAASRRARRGLTSLVLGSQTLCTRLV